jgi:hypothetical protein
MSSDGLHERGKALENSFFQQRDRVLLEKLQKDMTNRQSRDALKAVSGIEDVEVLDLMLEHNIDANTVAALSLIPLITVAWADSKMEESEKTALMKAAAASGITENSPSFMLLQQWTEQKPGPDLFETWQQYVTELSSQIDEVSREKVKSSLVERARSVATAAGGFLGIGSISSAEANVIKKCEQAFEVKS